MLRELAGVLGLRLDRPGGGVTDGGRYIDLLVEVREELRKVRQWALADRIRDRLLEVGVTLEDGPDGTRWEAR